SGHGGGDLAHEPSPHRREPAHVPSPRGPRHRGDHSDGHRHPFGRVLARRPEKEPAPRPVSVERNGNALTAAGLKKRFKTGRSFIEVLKGIEFDCAHGEVSMVMGPSGSGKSTLIAAMSGLLKPDEGQVTALGDSLWSMSRGSIDKFRLQHCGF